MAKRLMRFGIVLLGFTTVLVLLNGRLRSMAGALSAGPGRSSALYAMVSIDDDLARERFHPPEPGADRLPLRAIRLLALAHVVIGDARCWPLAPGSGAG